MYVFSQSTHCSLPLHSYCILLSIQRTPAIISHQRSTRLQHHSQEAVLSLSACCCHDAAHTAFHKPHLHLSILLWLFLAYIPLWQEVHIMSLLCCAWCFLAGSDEAGA